MGLCGFDGFLSEWSCYVEEQSGRLIYTGVFNGIGRLKEIGFQPVIHIYRKRRFDVCNLFRILVN